jgi:hypothetical protein
LVLQVSFLPAYVRKGLTFYSCFQSGPFKFIVGTDQQKFYINGEAIAELSSDLHRLVHGPMCESQTRTVALPDIAAEDFARLCQFAISDDYHQPNFIVKEREVYLDCKALANGGDASTFQSYRNGHDYSYLDPASRKHPLEKWLRSYFWDWRTTSQISAVACYLA